MAKKTLIIGEYETKNNKRKQTSPKVRKNIIIAVIAVVLVAAIGIYAFTKINDNKNSYIATVDGIKITIAEFDSALQAVVSEYKTKAAEEGVDTDDDSALIKWWDAKAEGSSVSRRQAAKEEALADAAKSAVQLKVAEEQGIRLTASDRARLITEAESEADYYANYYNQMGYGSYANGEAYVLSAYQMSYTEYKEAYTEGYIIGKLQSKIKGEMEPTEEQMKAWYENDKDAYDLYVTHAIYVSFLGEVTTEAEDGEETTETVVYKEGDEEYKEEYEAKTALITEIQDAIEKGEMTFAEIAEKYSAEEYTGEESTQYEFKLQKTDGKISMTNAEVVMDEVNEFLNETSLKDKSYKKIEVKGVASGDYAEDVVGVYIVKYDDVITYDTPDNEDAISMKSKIQTEVLQDMYDKKVDEWASEERFKPVLNGDIFKKVTVEGFVTE